MINPGRDSGERCGPPLLDTLCRYPFLFTAALQQISCGVFLKAVHDSPAASPLLPDHAFHSLSWAAAFSFLGVILYSVVCILLFTDLARACFAEPK